MKNAQSNVASIFGLKTGQKVLKTLKDPVVKIPYLPTEQ